MRIATLENPRIRQSVSMSHFFVTQPFYYNLKCFMSEDPVISQDISGYLVMKYFQSWNIFHSKIAPSSLKIFLVSDCIKMVYNNHFYTIWNIWTIKVLSPQWFKKNWKISMRYHIIYNFITLYISLYNVIYNVIYIVI